MHADIVICGLGPAGRALAHRCLVQGMSVIAVDPNPDRSWRATYAAWADELPPWLDAGAVAATVAEPAAYGRRHHRIPRTYAVLDTDRLQRSLDLTGATQISGRVTALDRHTVTTDSGRTLRAARVIDARGLRRYPGRAEQTAYGLVLERRDGADPALFMDWRADNGTGPDAAPSFLYTIPLGGDAVLFEETCLVGAPPIAPRELARRLRYRLRARGITVHGDERIERVRFPMVGAGPAARRFGAAGGYLHPATGYSVAASLSAADALATGTPGPRFTAHAVHRLRRAGLRALLGLSPADIPTFFDTFFDLDIELQRAYLSGNSDLIGTVTAMSRIFATLPGPVRKRLATTLLTPGPSHMGAGSVIME